MIQCKSDDGDETTETPANGRIGMRTSRVDINVGYSLPSDENAVSDKKISNSVSVSNVCFSSAMVFL